MCSRSEARLAGCCAARDGDIIRFRSKQYQGKYVGDMAGAVGNAADGCQVLVC